MFSDLKYALRQMRKSPGFAAAAVLTLALGIGANTAIFSLLDQALFRSLPVRDPQQLVLLEATPYDTWNGNTSIEGGDPEAYFSYPMYKDLRDQNKVFAGLIAMVQAPVGVRWHGQSTLVNSELVSGNYFDLLGVRPAVGRLLTQADDRVKNGNPVAVLSFNYWKNHFAADPHVVGQTLDINGHPFQILGVAAPAFESAIWGSPVDVFVPMTMKPIVTPQSDELDQHNARWLNILGRLKPGVTREQAQAALAPLWHALRTAELPLMGKSSPKFVAGFVTNSHLNVLDGARGFSYSRDTLRTPLIVVMAMAVLVLLMASVNVASLVLVRAAGRVREISMRYALGAGRERVVRQLFAEGLLLGLLGGAAGLLLAPAAIRFLVNRMNSGQNEPPFLTQLDGRVLVFGLFVAMGVSLLFTLAPAIQLWKPDLVSYLKQQGAGSVGGRLGFRRAVVGLQIGLSLLLLICAGLFARTLGNLRHVNVGFTTDHLITAWIDPELAGYDAKAAGPLNKRIVTQLAALPGVVSAAATDDPELEDNGQSSSFGVQGYTPGEDENMHSEQGRITPDYFTTLQVPLLAGRAFTDADTSGSQKVAVVNEMFAKRFFGSPQKAIGRMLFTGGPGKTNYDTRIVGVVGDYVHRTVRATRQIGIYLPAAQDPNPSGMWFYVRTWAAPDTAIGMIRQAVQRIDSKLAVASLSTMDSQISDNINDERMIALLAVSFGVLAMLLAAVGLYSVLAYATAQRTREIGVRMALGADRTSVMALVLRDMLMLAGISVAIALPVALLATRALRGELYGISNMDPAVFLPVTLLVLLVAVAAAAIPARRAAKVEPMQALRTE